MTQYMQEAGAMKRADQIPVRNVPADDLPEVLDLLLEHLGLLLMCERTPDYTSYELTQKVDR